MSPTETTTPAPIQESLNIIDGDIILVREENYEVDGVVVGMERAFDKFTDQDIDFVLVDFGGPKPGRIPLRGGALPAGKHLVKVS